MQHWDAFGISMASAVAVHVALYGVLELAGSAAPPPREGNTSQVDFELRPPPPPEPEKKVEEPRPLPPLPPQAAPPPKDPPRRIVEKPVVARTEPPPPAVEPSPEPPAPNPPAPDNSAPAPEFVYTMPSDSGGQGTMSVRGGSGPTGSPRGVRGGKGTGDGGGGAEDGDGTGGPQVVSVAAIREMPQPLGDYDFIEAIRREYPETALRDGIQGDVVVRILVDEAGSVEETKLIKGPRRDLNDKALKLVKRIRFKPGRDTQGKAVAVRISYTIKFVLPD